ncbi:winged helix-turn-helix domain-containing protein [Intestinirhabdus alba]|jgi:DNA-binding winged helix-turn-helix (wHTH) protein|uniref:Helix-turn-helix domain-containing protein n=1 Tax=Intestinirhabdus alba TaxID=2899544 RepID=A0A6L6IN73_9ENTR|nr:winged helix-turn-helix domain-containing protein [Intestinirhabdus alba]MTH46193.1 helix-turn-helix domain-containing protein [Intestinirhabdus alba]
MDKNKHLYGFIINGDTHFDIAHKRLFRISILPAEQSIYFGTVSLNDNMVRLLILLFENHMNFNEAATKDEIFKKVWEVHNKTASSQRLWHTIKELRAKLSSIGLPQDLIVNDRGSGYYVGKYQVTPLFY